MWLFTQHGFFSVVCARQGDGGRRRPVDPDRFMVRGRVRAHLEGLKARFPDLLGRCEIVEFAGSDYAHRFFVDKPTWTKVIAELSDEIDYDNFKGKVARHQGSAGSSYVSALHDVWSVMYGLQERSIPGDT